MNNNIRMLAKVGVVSAFAFGLMPFLTDAKERERQVGWAAPQLAPFGVPASLQAPAVYLAKLVELLAILLVAGAPLAPSLGQGHSARDFEKLGSMLLAVYLTSITLVLHSSDTLATLFTHGAMVASLLYINCGDLAATARLGGSFLSV